MTIEYDNDRARLDGVVSVEEAEGLLAWLLGAAEPRIDFTGCTHCHAAVLQLLMAARPAITAWPGDAAFAAWLRSALPSP